MYDDELSIVAGELSNYCYLLVIASNDTTIDISQNLIVTLTYKVIIESKLQ